MTTYADRINGVETAMAIKAPARFATTGNITLSGLQTIDGSLTAVGDRVFVWQQTDPTYNGLWDASMSAWTRSIDMNGARDVTRGTQVYITDGFQYAGATFTVTTVDPIVGSTAINAAPIFWASRITNPFYLGVGGQSNALGSDFGASTDWMSIPGRVYVWVPSLNGWRDAALRQGLEPFNANGSNNSSVWAALNISYRHGGIVRMIFAVEGSTEIEQWTGGGYRNGSPIATDRSVSATNRVQFKKWVDALAAAGVAQLDGLIWWQGEADLDTPEATYLSELGFLYSDLKARGVSPDPIRKFPMVVHGLYTGPKSGQQANRSRSLEKFARENQQFCGFAVSSDLAGRDDTPADPNSIINHFTSASYVTAGNRAGIAMCGMWVGNSVISDERLNDVTIPASGLIGAQIGNRTYEKDAVSSGTLSLVISNGQMRGETYPLSGTVTVNMDPNANSGLNQGGVRFQFYTLSNSDTITFKSDNGAGTTRQIQMMGEAAAANGDVGIAITGAAGRGTITYTGSRYEIEFWPRTAHSTAVIQAGTNTSRRMFNPAELRVAADAGITARMGVQIHSTDANISLNARGGTYIRQTATLTGNRILSLTSTGAIGGDRVVISREGAGAFNYTVRDATVTANAKILTAAGQKAEFIWNGTQWDLLY